MELKSSKPIKLTEKTLRLIFQGFGNDLGNSYGVYDTSREEEIQHMDEQIIQQILENQDIVDTIPSIQ